AAQPAGPPQPETTSQKPLPAGTAVPAPEGAPSEAAQVPPDAPVITIAGLCENPPADQSSTADCKTIITRAEFEGIVNAIAPNMAPFARKQLATRYASGLVMAQQAHKMGLDQGPKFDQMLKLARLQVTTQILGQNLQEKAGQIS